MFFYSPSTLGFYNIEINDFIPDDAIEIDDADHAALLDGQSAGKKIIPGIDGIPTLQDPPPPTEAHLITSIVSSVQSHMDQTAKSMGYDDIKTAVTYADEPAVPKFQTDGQMLRAWRSLVWEKCYALLDEVMTGEREPLDAEGVIALLPELATP